MRGSTCFLAIPIWSSKFCLSGGFPYSWKVGQLIAQANKDSKSTVSILRLNMQIRDCVCIQANCILNIFNTDCLNSSSPTYSFDILELDSVIILWMKSINMFPGSYKKAILQAVVFDIGKVFPDRLSSLSVQSQYSTKAFPKHYVVIAI